jgi:cytochrome c
MSDLKVNTVLGAVLASAMGVVALGIVAERVFEPEFPEKPGYEIDISSLAASTGGGAAPVEAGPPDWGVLLADASLVAAGEKVSAKCKSCHSFDKGGPNLTGPNQWGLVGRTAGTHPGFAYSAAMKAYGQPWTYDNLEKFIASPATDVNGTTMAFVGIKKPEDRHALIAWLRTQEDTPAPIPAPLPPKPEAATPAPAPG